LKTKTSNEEGNKKVVLQNEDVLAKPKATNGHATWNVFKTQQSVINYASTPPIVPRPHTPSTICEDVDEITSIPSSSLGLEISSSPSGKVKTIKAEMLQCQSISIAIMAQKMVVGNDDQKALIKVKMEDNYGKEKVDWDW
jgi:hypothetical protein